MATAIVIGVGNPVLADDAVGLVIARGVQNQLGSRSEVAVAEVFNGGLELMEAMMRSSAEVGRERSIGWASTRWQQRATAPRRTMAAFRRLWNWAGSPA
jgi:hypothetical protein